MDHRTALATFRTLALRAGTTARRTAGRTAAGVAREVRTRMAERRSTSLTPPPGSPPTRPAAPAPAAPTASRRAPSPTDVARAVSRNTAGLARTNPRPQRRRPAYRPVPGAKLPARRGIVGA